MSSGCCAVDVYWSCHGCVLVVLCRLLELPYMAGYLSYSPPVKRGLAPQPLRNGAFKRLFFSRTGRDER